MDWKPSKKHLPPAKWGLLHAQNGYRNRDNEIVTCANPHRNHDNEIVTCANVHRNHDNEIVTCANAHRNRDNEIVTYANAHRNRDNEIVTPTLRHQQSRWDFAHQGKPFTSLAMEALPTKQKVRSNCEVTLRARYMTKIHARYATNRPAKAITNVTTNKEWTDKPYLMRAIGFHTNQKGGKTDHKNIVCWRITTQ